MLSGIKSIRIKSSFLPAEIFHAGFKMGSRYIITSASQKSFRAQRYFWGYCQMLWMRIFPSGGLPYSIFKLHSGSNILKQFVTA